MARVVIENLSKNFRMPGGVCISAVRDLNMVIEDGELAVIVGPSGCGKTTTLRLIAGLEEVSAGRISIDGECVNEVAPKDRDIAMVFQNYALYPHMTVWENMAFGLKLRGVARAEVERRVGDVAESLGLAGCLKRKPHELSGGERQRVALGRALVREPKVFLFDEPLSNLDPQLRVQMRAEIARLHQRLKATMIYVTHDQTEAMTLGDRILVMRGGVGQQMTNPQALYHAPANLFVAGFIGSPSMNFWEGRVVGKGNGLEFEPGDCGEKVRVSISPDHANSLRNYVEKRVILGIRPEQVEVRGAAGERKEGIAARVELVERTGPEAYLYLRAGTWACTARVPAECNFKQQEMVMISLEMSRAHYFDPGSERSDPEHRARGG